MPEWHNARGLWPFGTAPDPQCGCWSSCVRARACASILRQGVGDGFEAGGIAMAGVLQPVCRADAPKLLRIATPIPSWSSVMGPIDSAT